jgi:hypothetical protein
LPVRVVPGLLVADDELLTWLRSYAHAGGHPVLVIWADQGLGQHVVDAHGRIRSELRMIIGGEVAPGKQHCGSISTEQFRPAYRRRGAGCPLKGRPAV